MSRLAAEVSNTDWLNDGDAGHPGVTNRSPITAAVICINPQGRGAEPGGLS